MRGQPDTRLFGAIETGGTKCVCAIGTATGDLLLHARVDTAEPAATSAALIAFFSDATVQFGALSALGIAAFGPIDLRPDSRTFGCLAATPKPGWSNTDLLAPFRAALDCPIGLDTDVNAAALAEHWRGATVGVSNSVYVTVGTGIGAGILVRGRPLHGLMHPEVGHIFPRRHPADGEFHGVCAFHGDCLEGLACGPAIVARSGAQFSSLASGHPQRAIEADYLGQLCAHLVLTVAPERIVFGGGVLEHAGLLPEVQARMLYWLRGYLDLERFALDSPTFIAAPLLGARAGILGALRLAIQAQLGR